MSSLLVWRVVYCVNVLLLMILASACGQPEPVTGQLLSRISERGELVVLTTNQPTTYYFGREGEPTGPEFDMTQAFAQHLGVEVRYEVLSSVEQVIASLKRGDGDIAAAGLTITQARATQFDFGAAYRDVSEYLVCHRKTSKVASAEALAELSIVVSAQTSYIETMRANYPTIKIDTDASVSTPKLLEKVRDQQVQCTISDSSIFSINRRYYPEIAKRYTLQEGAQLAWMFEQNNPALNQVIKTWFTAYQASGNFEQMNEKYFGHIEAFDYVDIQKFKRRIKSRLPKYKAMFIEAAQKYDIPPALLAAQSYQESHWNPRAKSPTGVRGIMMLTLPVAKSLGVTSRLNAEQNIFAGAKYFARMQNMFDEEVLEPDRTWMALAAYNVGRGHFRDAQMLAKKLGKSPYIWTDIKEVLPLLSDKKYYTDLRYGYARGNEPVQYVTRIRDYDDILEQEFTPNDVEALESKPEEITQH